MAEFRRATEAALKIQSYVRERTDHLCGKGHDCSHERS